MATLKDLILTLSGFGITITIIVTLLINLFQEKIKLLIKSNYDKEVEELKGLIGKNNLTHNNLISTFLNNYSKSQDNRILATKECWEYVLKIRQNIPGPVALAFQILTDDELNKKDFEQKNKPNIYNEIQNITDGTMFAIDADSCLEKNRLFVSKKLYFLIYIYRIFIYRSTFKLIENVKNGTPKSWKEDNILKENISIVIGLEEINKIYGNIFPAFSYVLSLFEEKILIEMENIIEGKELNEKGVNYIYELNKIQKDLQINRVEK